MSIKIGVIGAEVMGKGVAERFAKYGYDIVLVENNQDVRDHASLRNFFYKFWNSMIIDVLEAGEKPSAF